MQHSRTSKSKSLALGLLALILAAIAIAFLQPDGDEPRAKESDRRQAAAKAPAERGVMPKGPDESPASASSRSAPAQKPALPKASPRELLEKAQQSGSAEDALLAAQGIRACSWRIGSGQKLREALAQSGASLPPQKLDAMMASMDKPERACQELDAGMTAQYEPLLRRAVEGGVPSAAALWWLTPEARTLSTAADNATARDLLRRDALACDKRSLMAYQAVSFRFRDDFDPIEVAAVEAAAQALEKQGKLKGNRTLAAVKAFMPPGHVVRVALNPGAVKARTAEVLAACELALP